MAKIGKRVFGPYTGSWTASLAFPRNDGFIVDVDGILKCTPKGNVLGTAPTGTFTWLDAEVSLPVKGGQLYPIELGKADISGSTTLTTIWLVSGETR